MDGEITILLADSVNIFIELGKMYLKNTRARVLTCNNGKDALSMIGKERPDLVFLSAFMPEMDGIECCRRIKEDKSLGSTGVVLTLVSGSAENIESCLQAGCDDVLLKPVERRSFFAVVNKFVNLNKRNAPRFKDHFSVSVSRRNGETMNCRVFDVSSGGLFLEASPPLPDNAVVNLHFILPLSEEKICCKGRIAWVNRSDRPTNPGLPPGMGVEFLDLSGENAGAVERYLQKAHVAPVISNDAPLRKKSCAELQSTLTSALKD